MKAAFAQALQLLEATVTAGDAPDAVAAGVRTQIMAYLRDQGPSVPLTPQVDLEVRAMQRWCSLDVVECFLCHFRHQYTRLQ